MNCRGDLDVEIVLPSDLLSVRNALALVARHLARSKLPVQKRGDVELATAEALNNIVEHAYGYAEDGRIRLNLRTQGHRATVLLSDQGLAMGQSTARARAIPDPAGAAESGHVWPLLHALTDAISYSRVAATNTLRCEFAGGPRGDG